MSARLFLPALPGEGEFWGIEHVCDHMLFPGDIRNQDLKDAGRRIVIPDPWERHFHWSRRSAEWNARCKHPDPNSEFNISPLRARVLGKTAEDLAMVYLQSGGAIDYDLAADTLQGHILSETERRKKRFNDDLSDFFSEGNVHFARILGKRIGFLAEKIGTPIWTSEETTKVRVDLHRSGINEEEHLPIRANAGGEIDMLVRVGEGSDLGFSGLALCDIKCRTAWVSPQDQRWNPKPQAQLLCYGLLAAAGCDRFAERFGGVPDALVVINPVLGCIEAISTAKLPAYRARLTKIGQYVCGMDTSKIERALERFSDSNW